MSESEFESFTCNEFTVHRYGKGEPNAAFIGGITYSPSDFAEVARKMPGTNFVVNNPIHTGKVERSSKGKIGGITPWQDWLRDAYREVLEALSCKIHIRHSLGSFHTPDIDVPGLQGVVLANPPTNPQGAYSSNSRLDEFGLLDKCIADCCIDLADDAYRAMMEAHHAEYIADAPPGNLKDIFRHEIPRPVQDAVDAMVCRVRSSAVPVLFITGKRDPWNGKNLEKVTCLKHVSHTELDTSHFPQISEPEGFVETINNWKAELQATF